MLSYETRFSIKKIPLKIIPLKRGCFFRLSGLVLLLFSLALSKPAETALRRTNLDSPEVAAALDLAEAFFSSLTTVQGRFIQANPDGSYMEGTMYIQRPGRMRFEYDEPVPILLVADGRFFIHVDKQLEQAMHIPLDSTPANFLLSEELSIRDGLTLIGYERANGILRLQFQQTDEPDLGSMILTFTDDPIMLKQWTTIDARKNRTTVTLIAPRFGGALDPDLFYFYNPWGREADK